MAHPKIIIIKESVTEIKKLMNKVIPFIRPRLAMLLLIKENEKVGISKIAISEALSLSTTSVRIWRKLYEDGGIELLCKHNKIGFKPSVFTKDEELKLEKLLSDPENGLRGYKELNIWVKEEFKKDIKYNTLLKFAVRKFNSKSKVARKSHVNKNEEDVVAFKKTSVKSAKISGKKKRISMKK